MTEFAEFFVKLFDTADWPPRWICGKWSDFHGWLYIFSDITIWLAYFFIPVILIWFVQKNPRVPFLPVFWLFSLFIILCGSTHILDALMFWWPGYRLSALLRFFTAIVSLATVFALIKDLPSALLLKPEKELEGQTKQFKQSEERWQNVLNEQEEKIQELMAEIQNLKNAT